MTDAFAALNRLGLGARPGEADGLGDPREWALAQLARPAILGGDLPELPEISDRLRSFREAAAGGDAEAARAAALAGRRILEREAAAAFSARLGEAPFAERWIAFWSNHLCVSVGGKARLVPLAGLYEREAIRPHAFGHFADMLLSSARHPAMLLYLDNAQSIGPTSPAGRRSGRRGRAPRGLNENYARELLELHTVGVDGGYDQDDVVELARILTGWTVEGAGGPLGRGDPMEYRFVGRLHEPGPRTVLGRRFPEGGEETGEAVIRFLARHPSTARFLARKIAVHFVMDAPPPPLVAALERRWLDTEGDLAAVAEVLVLHPATWNPEARKFRTPQDWIVAMIRAMGGRDLPPPFLTVLRQLRHPIWAPSAPKGWGDTTNDWADPDALMNRAELARTVATRLTNGRPAFDPRPLATTVPLPDGDPLPAILAESDVAVDERLALAFAGPAFQWR